jgi:hypothetical protein
MFMQHSSCNVSGTSMIQAPASILAAPPPFYPAESVWHSPTIIQAPSHCHHHPHCMDATLTVRRLHECRVGIIFSSLFPLPPPPLPYPLPLLHRQVGSSCLPALLTEPAWKHTCSHVWGSSLLSFDWVLISTAIFQQQQGWLHLSAWRLATAAPSPAPPLFNPCLTYLSVPCTSLSLHWCDQPAPPPRTHTHSPCKASLDTSLRLLGAADLLCPTHCQ